MSSKASSRPSVSDDAPLQSLYEEEVTIDFEGGLGMNIHGGINKPLVVSAVPPHLCADFGA